MPQTRHQDATNCQQPSGAAVGISELLHGAPPTARIIHHKYEWGQSWHYAACGNDDCKVSSGIHAGPTFGRGKLDHYGYWEIPCAICARDRERTYPEDGECWPFKPCNERVQP